MTSADYGFCANCGFGIVYENRCPECDCIYCPECGYCAVCSDEYDMEVFNL